MTDNYERIRKLLLEKVSSFGNDSAAARAIGVHPSTVHRWVKGERGKNIQTQNLIHALTKLGVSMSEIGNVLVENERDAALLGDIIDLVDDDRKLVEAFARLKTLDSDKRRKAIEFLELIGSNQ